MAEPTTIGSRLRQARLRAKLSQRYVANELGATRQMVSAWEHDLAKPRMGHLAQACELYGCSVNEIMFGLEGSATGVAQQLQGARPEERSRIELMCRVFARPGAPDPYPALVRR